MPGRGSYGPGGRWIHDRAHRIMEESEGTPKNVAYAIATQQAHKVGRSPKGFRTSEGVAGAKAKYQGPRSMYQKTAEVEKEPFYMRPPPPAFMSLVGAGGGYSAGRASGLSREKSLLAAALGATLFGGIGYGTKKQYEKKYRGPVKEYKKTAMPRVPKISRALTSRIAQGVERSPSALTHTGLSVVEPKLVEKSSTKPRAVSRRGVQKVASMLKEAKGGKTKEKRRIDRIAERESKKQRWEDKKARMAEAKARAAPRQGAPQPVPKQKVPKWQQQRHQTRPAPAPQAHIPKSTPAPHASVPKPSTVPSAAKPVSGTVKQVSKLRRYGVPIGIGLGAAALGGLAYAAHRREQSDKSAINKYFNKTAMLVGLFDELEKISQAPAMPPTPPTAAPSPGMGAQNPGAMGNLGGSASVPPPQPPPVQDAANMVGPGKGQGISAAGMGT
jgi:hypothetical protein